jgi:signal transduction histidine kinase
MRRMLGVLRAQGPEPPAPLPGVDSLTVLIEQTERAGIHVTLAVEGAPRELSPGLDLAAYRIVQEALTNVVMHSGTDSAFVKLGYEPDAIVLEVTDRGIGADLSSGAPGHGITGMRERVAMCGGSFHAGPRPGGGFRVTARLPLGER